MNPLYNLFVIINTEVVLRCENTHLNKITIKDLFDGLNYKLLIK